MAWHLLLSVSSPFFHKITLTFIKKKGLLKRFFDLKLDIPNLSWLWTIWLFKDTYFDLFYVGRLETIHQCKVPTVPPLYISINSLQKCLFFQLRMFFELFCMKGSAWNACILDSIQLPTGQLDLNYANVRYLK